MGCGDHLSGHRFIPLGHKPMAVNELNIFVAGFAFSGALYSAVKHKNWLALCLFALSVLNLVMGLKK